MKIATTADWHFHAYKAHSRLLAGRKNSRLVDIERTWFEVVDDACRNGCEMMLVAGDMFNVRGSLRPSVLNSAVACLEYAAGYMPVVFIPGNHDMEDFKGGPTAVDTFEALNHVYVMGGPSVMALRDITIVGVPYQNNLEEFTKVAKGIPERKPDIIMCHQGIDSLAPKGVPAHGFTVEAMQGVFGNDVPIVCGHYHKPGQDANVIQIGAPLQHNFGDEGQQRGYWVIDLDPTDGAWGFEFRDISLAPKFITVTEGMEAPIIDGDFVRVKASSASSASKLAKCIEGAGDISVVIEREYAAAHEETISVGTVPAMLDQYFKAKGLGESEIKNALSLYEEVCG
jgi:DNA repair exonuclease SbcCD nuclease subunit